MRIISIGGKYESKIYVIDDEKLIFKLHCMCDDFMKYGKKLIKVNEGADKRVFEKPCKHLSPFVERLEKMGYKLKLPKEMVGPKKLTPKLRRELLERVNNICENPGCESTLQLQIHRKTRGSNNGRYNKENCVVLCKECHKLRHYGEFK